jgi:hypothetical protein
VIPEAAVDAAAKAAYEVMPVELFGRDHPVTWEQLSESALGRVRKEAELAKARAALDAGAPHILAEAFNGAAGELADRMNDPGDYANKNYWTGPAYMFLIHKAKAAEV